MTDHITPETDAKRADDPHPPHDWPAYARALEIHIHLLRAELADERAKKSDALIAAVDDLERLTAENERLATGNHSMEQEIPQLRHAVERLRAALDEYGEHQGDCPKKYHGMKDARPCTCGLDEARAERDALKQAHEFHDKLGITLLDAKYLDPACHKGCQSIKHRNEIAAAQQTVARLREVLQRIVNNGGSATNVMLFDARTALAQ